MWRGFDGTMARSVGIVANSRKETLISECLLAMRIAMVIRPGLEPGTY